MKDDETKIKTKEKKSIPEFVDEFEGMDVENLIPSMNVNEITENPPEEPIIENEELLNIYDEILENCRKDRENADEILINFVGDRIE